MRKKLIEAEAVKAREEYQKAARENREERKRTRRAVEALRWVLDHPNAKKVAPAK